MDRKTDFRAITEIDSRHYSLPLYFAPDFSAYKQYGTFVAEWKPADLAAGKAVWRFEATGKMVGNGTYDITFVRTRGTKTLTLGKLVQYKRDEVLATLPQGAKLDADNAVVTYRLTQETFEAGVPFYIEVETESNGATDTYGYVFIKKIE